MVKDQAFGAVVLKNESGSLKVLLVKKPAFTSWDLPKGHKEGEETDEEAARREIQEETGYTKFDILNRTCEVNYLVEKESGLVYKSVVFYLALQTELNEVPQANPDDDSDEEDMEVAWIDADKAVEFVTFPPFQNALYACLGDYSLRAK